jgi:hypothetical protein
LHVVHDFSALASVAGMAVGNLMAMTLSLAGVGALLAASRASRLLRRPRAALWSKRAGGGGGVDRRVCSIVIQSQRGFNIPSAQSARLKPRMYF